MHFRTKTLSMLHEKYRKDAFLHKFVDPFDHPSATLLAGRTKQKPFHSPGEGGWIILAFRAKLPGNPYTWLFPNPFYLPIAAATDPIFTKPFQALSAIFSVVFAYGDYYLEMLPFHFLRPSSGIPGGAQEVVLLDEDWLVTLYVAVGLRNAGCTVHIVSAAYPERLDVKYLGRRITREVAPPVRSDGYVSAIEAALAGPPGCIASIQILMHGSVSYCATRRACPIALQMREAESLPSGSSHPRQT